MSLCREPRQTTLIMGYKWSEYFIMYNKKCIVGVNYFLFCIDKAESASIVIGGQIESSRFWNCKTTELVVRQESHIIAF